MTHDGRGPGIEIYGSEDAARGTQVTRNFVVHAANNAGIEVGGPEVVVVDNVVVGGGDGAIYVYAYWDGVHDVTVAGNTVVNEGAGGVRVASEATAVGLYDNAGYSTDGSSPFPESAAGIDAAANVACPTPEACWADFAAWDFGPVEGGRLRGGGVAVEALDVDFCGVARAASPTVGAFEDDGPGPLSVALKATFACDAGGPAAGADPGDDSAGPGGCGCAHTDGAAMGLGVVTALVFATRRWRGPVGAGPA
jgi:MYXO-CTERM domain-containing protein